MRRIFKILFLFLVMFPFVISAAEVSLSCPATANSGEDITCSINISSGGSVVAGFQANVSASSGLSYKSYSVSSGWAGSSSANKFLVYGNKVSGKSTLGKYVYTVNGKANEKFTVSLTGISVSDENANVISSNSSTSATIRIKCTDNYLKSLSIDGVGVAGFNKDTLSYNITTEKSSINITASANSSYAKISGTGNKTVKYGKNVFDVVVTSESGAKKTYKINVTRPDNREKINTLSSLSVEGHNITPNFASNVTSYKLSVKSDVTSINVKATKTSAKSSFVSGFGERNVKLNYGVNNVLVKVKSENESVNTYTIVVTREDNRSSNNYLSSLTLSEGKIKFDKNTLNYSIITDKTSIKVDASVEDSKSTLTGNKTYDLVNGINEIKVIVTAENGSKREYVIKVTKTEDLGSINSSNNLSSLKIIDNKFSFSPEILEYDVKIDDGEDKLNLDYLLEDENASVEIIGNENLKDGSVVTLKVTDIAGEIKEYKINISKEEVVEEKKNSLNIILIVLLIVSIIGNIIFVILFLGKNKKDTNIVSNENVISNVEGNE